MCADKPIGKGFDEIKELILSMKPVSIIAGRRKVWDHLAGLYTSTKGELQIMGEGADLSDDCVKKDFSRLGKSTQEILRKKRNVTRIQTVDTWVAWLKWLGNLMRKFPTRFNLYFTIERLKFVPQLNIRDREEVVSVPPEESIDVAYATRIMGNEEGALSAIQAHRSHFNRMLNISVRFSKPTLIEQLVKNLEAAKKIQTSLLVACEFVTQKKAEKKKFEEPEYRSVQQYFTLDQKLYKGVPWKSLKGTYNKFYTQECKTLGDVLYSIYPQKYSDDSNKRLDEVKMAQRIVKRIPNGSKVMDPNRIAVLLNNEHIRGSALSLSEYLCTSLFYIIQRFSK